MNEIQKCYIYLLYLTVANSEEFLNSFSVGTFSQYMAHFVHVCTCVIMFTFMFTLTYE